MLDDLIELLRKIDTQKKPVGVEVNYDGDKFRWQVRIGNMTAEEFSARKRKQEPEVRTMAT